MARWIVFTDSGFWKYSWAHIVMSMTQSCRWVMQWSPKARRPRASNKCLRSCPLRTEISPVSLKRFDAVMHCRWWDLQSLCNLALRNVVFKVFHNLFMHPFTDWRANLPILTSERPCLSRGYLHLVTSCVFFWLDTYPIVKRPGVNALRNAFEMDINPITQTTSGGGLGRIPDETGQV